ncbi:AP-4 complex subunit epsilon-1-like isoform X2 [Glandiceps talaboti]
MVFGGQVIYKDKTNTAKRLFFNCSLYMSDFLRPSKITTEEFGQKWTRQSRDKKLRIENSKVKTMSEYMKVVAEKLHLYPVEIIGICC